MDNKILLSFPKLETGQEEKAISDCVYILQKAGFVPATVNTAMQPNEYNIEPYKVPDYSPDQLNAIKDIMLICDNAVLNIYGEIGLPKPRA